MSCIATVRERKAAERRVALSPAGAGELVRRGHRVLVEAGAGTGAGYSDDRYLTAGAEISRDIDHLWREADLMVKVKEPVKQEYGRLHEDLILFTYLHLAADRHLTSALLDARVTAVGYETVTDGHGGLPLLAPMSEIAGRLAAQQGAHHLLAPHGGPGVLIGGAPGVHPARVLVIGGGTVGAESAAVAVGLGADVIVLERAEPRIRQLARRLGGRCLILRSDSEALLDEATRADLIIAAVLIPGAAAPKLITNEVLGRLARGSVLVDVAIDQGGCAVSSRPTTHESPTFERDGVVHYCVTNMPAAVPITATRALTGATLPYVLALADQGRSALETDPLLATGLNTAEGRIVHPEVLHAFNQTELALR